MPCYPAMPCGFPFCATALRLLWPMKAFTMAQIGAIQGVTPPAICRRAEQLGIWDERPHGKPSVFSERTLRALWADDRLTNDQIAQRLNLHPRMLSAHARRLGLGLPRRRFGQKIKVRFDDDFAPMWAAQVLRAEIARHYGCTIAAVDHEVHRRGLPRRRRKKGWLEGAKSLAQYRLKIEADRTAAALRDAEMIDGPYRPTVRRAA